MLFMCIFRAILYDLSSPRDARLVSRALRPALVSRLASCPAPRACVRMRALRVFSLLLSLSLSKEIYKERFSLSLPTPTTLAPLALLGSLVHFNLIYFVN